MYTTPSAHQMIEAVMLALKNDILPALQDAKATSSAEYCLAVLQMVKQRVPVEQQLYAKEAREMAELYAEMASLLRDDTSAEAGRVRERHQRFTGAISIPEPASYDTLEQCHRELSQALIPTLDDLHALAKSNPKAMQALTAMRRHLGVRATRDLGTYLGAPGGAAAGR